MVLKRNTLGISLGVTAAAALVGFFAVRQPAVKGAGQPGPPGSAAVEETARVTAEVAGAVKVSEARTRDLVIRLRSPGEAVTDRRAVIKAGVAGVLKELRVREGLHVRAGELLARLGEERYRLALERQEADRLRLLSETLLEKRFGPAAGRPGPAPETAAKAGEDFAAAEADHRRGLMSPADFALATQDYELALIESGMRKDEVMAASTGLTQAEIDVRTARLDLAMTTITAPFSGIITGITVSPGEHLEPGRDLFTLVDIGEIKVLARVLESEVGKIRAGREADLRFSAYPDRVFRGAVEAVSPVVNPEDKTCAVQVVVENHGEKIKPGMHVEVEIAAEIYKDRLLVPLEAVLVRGGRKLVFVVEKGLAKWRYVEVGLENESFAEILDGVREGEKVVVDGHFSLAHDAAVAVIE